MVSELSLLIVEWPNHMFINVAPTSCFLNMPEVVRTMNVQPRCSKLAVSLTNLENIWGHCILRVTSAEQAVF